MSDIPTADRYARAKDVFLQALERPPEEREGFVGQMCADDPELRDEILALLDHHATTDERIDSPILPGPLSLEAPFAIPEHLGRFRILGLLGWGAMGVVYRALDVDSSHPLALKVLRQGAPAILLQRRFEREAEALRRLDHPGIARFLEAGTIEREGGSLPYIAMELIEGLHLREAARQQALTRRQRLELIAALCDAVQYAHDHGVIHRDLKPENILVGEDRQPKILDFGIARVMDLDQRAMTITRTGGFFAGTVRYMSPEQVQASGPGVGPRSDLYSLGVIAYEFLTGRLPYEISRRSIEQAVLTIVQEHPVPLGAFDESLRGDVETIIAKTLEKLPDDRYGSAAEVAADIRRHLADRRIVARPRGRLQRWARTALRQRRRSSILAVAGAMGIALGGFGLQRFLSARQLDEATALRPVLAALESVDFKLHLGARSQTDVADALVLLNEARDRLWRLPPRAYTAHLKRYVCWRLGEAHYFLGTATGDPEHLEDAAGMWTETGRYPLEANAWKSLPESTTVAARLAKMREDDYLSGIGLAHAALAELKTPVRNLTVSLEVRQRALINYSQTWSCPDPNCIPSRNRHGNAHLGMLLNEYGESCVLLGAVLDSLALIDEGLSRLTLADTARTLDEQWAARGSLLQNCGIGWRERGRITGREADFARAIAHFERAGALRSEVDNVRNATETRRDRADAEQACASWQTNESERSKWLESSYKDARRAQELASSLGSPFLISSCDRVLGQVLVSIALRDRSMAPIQDARVRLTAAMQALDRARHPVPYALIQLERARLERTCWEITNDPDARVRALDELSTAENMLPREQHPRMHVEIDRERAALQVEQ